MANNRIAKIRRKYGADCYRKWGRRGGSPILRAWSEGKITLNHKRKKKR